MNYTSTVENGPNAHEKTRIRKSTDTIENGFSFIFYKLIHGMHFSSWDCKLDNIYFTRETSRKFQYQNRGRMNNNAFTSFLQLAR